MCPGSDGQFKVTKRGGGGGKGIGIFNDCFYIIKKKKAEKWKCQLIIVLKKEKKSRTLNIR